MNRSFLAALLGSWMVVDACCAIASDERRPAAPDGYTWQPLEEIGGAVLLPAGWRFEEKTGKGVLAYRIIKEKSGPMLTGLTINVVRDMPSKAKTEPSRYSMDFAGKYRKDAQQALDQPQVDRVGGILRITCQVIKRLPEVDKDRLFHIRLTTLANDKTGTLYILIFGSPEDEWEEAYKIGKRLFSPIILKQDY